MRNLKRALVGYHKQSVRDLIHRLRAEHEQSKQQLEQELLHLEQEIANLKKRLEINGEEDESNDSKTAQSVVRIRDSKR